MGTGRLLGDREARLRTGRTGARPSRADPVPRRMLLLAGLPAVFAASACSDPDTGLVGTERVPATLEIEVDPPVLFEGEDGQAFATLRDEQGRAFERLPPWVRVESSDEEVVAVPGSNRFEARKPGAARLTIRSQELEAEATIGVNPLQLDYEVAAVYVNQAAQDRAGSVPLVAGRPGFLRVFLRGDEVNFFDPDVRVRVYHDGTLVKELRLSPVDRGIPRAIDEDVWEGSWGAPLSGSLIQPGLELGVEADPGGVVPLAREGPVLHPADGDRIALDVRELAPLKLTLVPVDQSEGDVASALTPDNAHEYTEAFYRMFPVGEWDVEVRERYTTSQTARSAQGWVGILEEMAALQVSEGGDRYYYGLTQARFGTQIRGIAFVGFPASLGYDGLPGADSTLAHELGHNMGLWHAPCGSPAPQTVDREFPHDGGRIGTTGVDVDLEEIRPSGMADVMGYCSPRWISDYMYRRALEFREANEPFDTSEDDEEVAGSVLVFGSVHDGRVRVSPAFQVDAPPSLPSGEGDYVLEGRDEGGATLFRYRFDPATVADVEGSGAGFAFVLPPDVAHPDRLREVRVQGPSDAATRRSTLAPADPDDEIRAEATRTGTRVRWDAERRPMAMIRDARTGRILSFARGGEVTLPGRRGEVMVNLSHGTGSFETRVPVRRR